ncbi:Flp family type IVb pilin [Neorhizobium sp. CSC1952]|uniref:Flp family type IVb pilin n=1 Tax=Neorhizobium sp. CSC1952 TaxID=2978974 RepID=UPI0025A5E13A|nr:Flp family type IVb pilin [Rhizobium sp. CSC1952]WJR68479.1 Flp family type IVb pilin [Rhizobium sp. CSC1952]
MSKIFARFLKDESGATAIEYGLIAALISVALITGATTLGEQLGATFTSISGEMEAAAGAAANAGN